MRIIVSRFVSDSDATLSLVSVDGEFICFGLEDEYRETKVPGETRVPAGEYPVRMRREGGFHSRYANKFGTFHQGMLHIQDIPDFEYVLIHIGNSDEDTAGCLLLGENANTSGELRITSSTSAYKKFYKLVKDAAIAGELMIEFVDLD